jgi:hypothetical protein
MIHIGKDAPKSYTWMSKEGIITARYNRRYDAVRNTSELLSAHVAFRGKDENVMSWALHGLVCEAKNECKNN